MKGMTRFLAVTASGVALLVGGLAPSAFAGRNVTRDLGIVTNATACQVTVTVITTRVPVTATTDLDLYWWDSGTERSLGGYYVGPSTDLRSFTQTWTLSAPVYHQTLHAKATVYKWDKSDNMIQIGYAETGSSEFASIHCT